MTSKENVEKAREKYKRDLLKRERKKELDILERYEKMLAEKKQLEEKTEWEEDVKNVKSERPPIKEKTE